MSKKGFTMTEVLAVMVILGLLALIAIPTYKNQVEKSKTKIYESYTAKVEDGAKKFVTECVARNKCKDSAGNDISYYEDNNNGISIVESLVGNNYMEALKDPKGGDNCVGMVYISGAVHEQYDSYIYESCIKCNDNYKSKGCSTLESDSNYNNVTVDTTVSSKFFTNTKTPKISLTGYSNDIEVVEKTNASNIATCQLTGKNKGECNLNINGTTTFSINNKLTGKNLSDVRIFYDTTKPVINYSVSGSDIDGGWAKSRTIKIASITDNNDSNNIKKQYKIGSESWVQYNSSQFPLTRTYNKNQSVSIRAKDSAGNQRTETVTIEKVTNDSPTITVSALPTSSVKTASVKITIGFGSSGVDKHSESTYQYFLSTSENPSYTGTLSTYTNDTNFTIGSGLTGTYYLFIKQVKNQVNNATPKKTGDVDISGSTYHKYGPIIFDNTGPTGCTIKKTPSTSSPYVTLSLNAKGSDTSGIKGYSWENSTNGSDYVATLPSKTVYKNAAYRVYAMDNLGNKSSCGSTSLTNINDSAPTITFKYNDNSTLSACYNNSVNIKAIATSNSIHLSKFESWANDNKNSNYNLTSPVDAKTAERTISFSGTGSYFINASATIDVVGSTAISATNKSSTAKVDASKPYTPYLSVSIDKNQNSLKTSNCGTSSSTANQTCSIEYKDLCGFNHSGDPTLTFEFYSSSGGCSSISKFQYSTNNSSWTDETSSSINSKLASVITELNGNWGSCRINEATVYVRSVNEFDRVSPVLTINLKRHIG